jgi:hypothetical protein
MFALRNREKRDSHGGTEIDVGRLPQVSHVFLDPTQA